MASTTVPAPLHAHIAAPAADRQTTPLWLYEFEARAITWANRAGLDLWRAPSVEALAARAMGADMSRTVEARLRQYCADFRANPARVINETWTLYPGGQPVALALTFSWHPLPDDRPATLVEAHRLSRQDPATVRAIDWLLHSQVMTALYAEDGRELFANRSLREALGTGPHRFGDCFFDKKVRDTFYAALLRNGIHRDTAMIATIKGPRWYDIQAVRCRDAATGETAFQVSATDVTAIRAQAETLRATLDLAQSADRAKSEFVASMSHEMRTPMNGIMGMVELLSHSALDPRQRKQVEVIRDSGAALMALIEDVLDLSCIELRATRIERAPLDLHTVATSVIDGLMPPALTKGLDLTLSIAPDIGTRAFGDARRLAQVMRNLIGNAVRYTDRGWVHLALTRGPEDSLRVEVIDTGPGVPPDQRHAIFEKFRRGVGDHVPPQRGIGLGLSICREIVTLMGGQIGMSPADTGGSCFWFTAPNTFTGA